MPTIRYMNDLFPGINSALHDMIRRGQLGENKLTELRRLKKLVDAFALLPHIGEEELLRLEEKYGERPHVITWGDYFQTEVGSRYFESSDLEFSRIVETVKYDLISAVMIFKGKPSEFIDMIKRSGNEAYNISQDQWSSEQEQAAHLYILCNYYEELGLEQRELTDEEREWFANFTDSGLEDAVAG